MKKFLAKITACLLVIFFLLTLTSCKENVTTNDPANKGAYKPNITISFSPLSYVQYIPVLEKEGWTLENNKMIDLYKKELGINLKIDISVDDIGLYFEKLAAGIAAGVMADLVMMGDLEYGVKNLTNANTNGLLADLTEIIKNYASDEVKELFEKAGPEIFYPGTFDGKIKTIPWVTNGAVGASSFIYFRQDWLDNAGKKLPKNIDELTSVLRSFKQMGSYTGINSDSFYGMAFGGAYCTAGQNFCPIFNMYNAFPDQWIEKDGKLVAGIIQPEMKNALSLLRQWFTEGLISQNFETLGGLHYTSQEVSKGLAGALYGSTAMGFIPDLKKINSDAEVVAMPIFSATNKPLKISSPANGFMFHGVSASCKYPEALMKMYNLYVEKMRDPAAYEEYFKPIEVARGNSYPAAQFSPVRTGDINIEGTKKLLEAAKNKNNEGLLGSQLDTYNKYIESIDNQTYQNYGTYLQWKENGIQENFIKLFESGVYQTDKFFSTKTPAMLQYETDLTTLAYVAFNEIIKGTVPVDAFDQFVEQWKELGGNSVTEEVNSWYSNIKGSN